MSKTAWTAHLMAVAGSLKRSDPSVIEHLEQRSGCKDCRARLAARRANRNARERNQAMRDLGLVRTPYGYE